MIKSWVVVKFVKDCASGKAGSIKAWRDYGDYAWGSALYEVLGYHKGSQKEALRAYK